MITNIQPTSIVNGIHGFYLSPKLFVPMEPHSGNVGVLPTRSGKGCGYRLVTDRHPHAKFCEEQYCLELKERNEPRRNEAFQIAANSGKRLVVTYKMGVTA